MHLNSELYSQKFSGKFFAIKITGSILTDEKSTSKLIQEIEILNKNNIRVVLVFGAGTQISQNFPESKKIKGVRVTKKEYMPEIKKIVEQNAKELLEKFITKGINATMAKNLCVASAKSPEYEATGEPRYFDRFAWDEVQSHSVILIPSILPNTQKPEEYMNVNADHIMQFVAQNILPEKVIFLTPLVLQDAQNKKISICTRRVANKFIAEGVIKDGMLEKVKKIFALLDKGIKRIQLLQYEDSIIEEVFSVEGRGTMFIDHWEHELIWKKGSEYTREFLCNFLKENPSNHVKARTIEEIIPNNFWVLEFDGFPAAIGHLEPLTDEIVELGSFVVNGEMAGHGLGSYFVRNIVSEITRKRTPYCLAVTDNPSAAYIFESHKFKKFNPEKNTQELCEIVEKRKKESPGKEVYIYKTFSSSYLRKKEELAQKM